MDGSPPRVRGIRHLHFNRHDSIRFTPAGAGNTGNLRSSSMRLSVHPRGCGEYLAIPSEGLSDTRFTPAGAGNT